MVEQLSPHRFLLPVLLAPFSPALGGQASKPSVLAVPVSDHLVESRAPCPAMHPSVSPSPASSGTAGASVYVVQVAWTAALRRFLFCSCASVSSASLENPGNLPSR